MWDPNPEGRVSLDKETPVLSLPCDYTVRREVSIGQEGGSPRTNGWHLDLIPDSLCNCEK